MCNPIIQHQRVVNLRNRYNLEAFYPGLKPLVLFLKRFEYKSHHLATLTRCTLNERNAFEFADSFHGPDQSWRTPAAFA